MTGLTARAAFWRRRARRAVPFVLVGLCVSLQAVIALSVGLESSDWMVWVGTGIWVLALVLAVCFFFPSQTVGQAARAVAAVRTWWNQTPWMRSWQRWRRIHRVSNFLPELLYADICWMTARHSFEGLVGDATDTAEAVRQCLYAAYGAWFTEHRVSERGTGRHLVAREMNEMVNTWLRVRREDPVLLADALTAGCEVREFSDHLDGTRRFDPDAVRTLAQLVQGARPSPATTRQPS